MAQTNYSKNTALDHRRENIISRDEYLKTAREFAKRGQELPQSKLMDIEVIEIRSMIKQRENLRKYLKEHLSNDAIAKKFDIHCRTVEKISTYETWSHLI